MPLALGVVDSTYSTMLLWGISFKAKIPSNLFTLPPDDMQITRIKFTIIIGAIMSPICVCVCVADCRINAIKSALAQALYLAIIQQTAKPLHNLPIESLVLVGQMYTHTCQSYL